MSASVSCREIGRKLACVIVSALLVSACASTGGSGGSATGSPAKTATTDRTAPREASDRSTTDRTSESASTGDLPGTVPDLPPTSEAEYSVRCQGEVLGLRAPLGTIARTIESQALMYDTVELSDCSGIFHRVLQAMVAQCANLSPPKPSQFRDTRDLARFYHQKGQLVLIQDALEQAQLIKPGAVLFYGYAGVRYQDFSAEDLFARGNGIEHMGVVVSVTRDSEGRVVSYRLFHGRSTGKIAAVTSYHLRRPTRSDLPPLGNWDQQWVAFAPLFGS